MLGLATGGVLGVGLPSPHPRLDLEVGLALGVQHVAVTAQLAQRPGTAELGFWAPLGAAQAIAAFALSPTLAAIASARVEGAPVRDVLRDVTYCERRGCYPAMRESWAVGGVNAGVALGLRFLFE